MTHIVNERTPVIIQSVSSLRNENKLLVENNQLLTEQKAELREQNRELKDQIRDLNREIDRLSQRYESTVMFNQNVLNMIQRALERPSSSFDVFSATPFPSGALLQPQTAATNQNAPQLESYDPTANGSTVIPQQNVYEPAPISNYEPAPISNYEPTPVKEFGKDNFFDEVSFRDI